ncbi:hypothetical protein [Endozoicomonas sp. GU-1]|uniref:hypothetical protein n=1 Tax=Endozoicomonas sp. GU-1 TaxID=3009078 RepID=UPI0022B2EAFF|nr:hypothetical protein [Endozoicomonas sp. GU-1]WBA79720.1 hypothetical protein O2T12_15255 [Endozoicomonas sp. GU-1]WBA87306.1 hypothetical protein O3276_04530 [Endozoicomonas sp. GU-1]
MQEIISIKKMNEILSDSVQKKTNEDINMTLCFSTNNTAPVLQGNHDATTQSPDNSTRRNGKDLLKSTLTHAAYAIAFGSYTTLVNQFVVSALNQPRDDFLAYHCFNNLTSDERKEYAHLTPYAPVHFAQVAVASTAFFLPPVAFALCMRDANLFMTGHAPVFPGMMSQQINPQETIQKSMMKSQSLPLSEFLTR